MIRLFFISLFMIFSLSSIKAQQVSPTDVIQNNVILFLPNATKGQLDNLSFEFEKYHQIKKAVYVPGNHKCLAIETKPDNNIRFYSDIIKIVSAHIPLSEIKLKTPEAYTEIYGKGDNNTFITVKK